MTTVTVLPFVTVFLGNSLSRARRRSNREIPVTVGSTVAESDALETELKIGGYWQ